MEMFLAKCILDTTIDGISVGSIYRTEYSVNYKIIYNETKTTYESVIGSRDWFYEHFKPVRCNSCGDRDYCNTYCDGREYACYGYEVNNNE